MPGNNKENDQPMPCLKFRVQTCADGSFSGTLLEAATAADVISARARTPGIGVVEV